MGNRYGKQIVNKDTKVIMMIYIIIAAVIILLIYIRSQKRSQIKETKRLASKNQYIDAAGHTREWPVGSFIMQGRGLRPFHNFYNSTQ
mgnify:CR=1 FL=1